MGEVFSVSQVRVGLSMSSIQSFEYGRLSKSSFHMNFPGALSSLEILGCPVQPHSVALNTFLTHHVAWCQHFLAYICLLPGASSKIIWISLYAVCEQSSRRALGSRKAAVVPLVIFLSTILSLNELICLLISQWIGFDPARLYAIHLLEDVG